MPDGDKFKIQPRLLQLNSIQHLMLPVLKLVTNHLPEAPTSPDKIYTVDGKKYAQPKFRIKTRNGGGITPDSDAFWFTREKIEGKVKINCIIEIYRPEADVHPLSVRNSAVTLQFQSGAHQIQKKLTITQSPFINQVNVLQDLHAEADLEWEEVKDLIIGLREASFSATFNLAITAELWWQKTQQDAPVFNPIILNPILIGTTIAKPVLIKESVKRERVVLQPAKPLLARDRASRFKHILADKVITPVEVKPAPGKPPTTTPQKIDLSHTLLLQYTKDDVAVFGVLSDQFEIKELKWKAVALTKNTGNYTINYRPTTSPDTFYFLPQDFRINVNEHSGDPKIAIAMVTGTDPSQMEGYRIKINLQLVPYFNPKAKKDLFTILDKESGGVIKYCDLRLGGFSSANFKLRDAFAGDNAVFRGKVPDQIDKIDPVSGFTLTVDCTLESFDFFKREIKDGFTIGDIIFDLPYENAQGQQTLQQSVPVYLDIRKLAGIPLGTAALISDTSINGFSVINNNSFPVSLGGVEVTLLSEINRSVYDADYIIGVQATWPKTLVPAQQEDVLLIAEEIDVLPEETCWTQLISEPFGVTLTEDPDKILAKVIDYATGDPQIWELQVNCPLFERWAELDENTLLPYRQIDRVEVEIKNSNGNSFAVMLSRTQHTGLVKMASSIAQILKTQQLSDRQYQYRIRTHYILDQTPWTEWIVPESTASNYLSIRPQQPPSL